MNKILHFKPLWGYYCCCCNTQNAHFVHIFIILADSLSNCPLFNCLQKCLKCWPMNMGSARWHFLHSLIAASITFCSRPIQTSPVASWIHQYSSMLCLFNRRAAAQQQKPYNLLLVAIYLERWHFIKFFLLILMHILSVLFFLGSAEANVGWGETEWPFDGQLCCEYVYEKLLKMDNPSSSYGRKKFGVFFMPHSVVRDAS